MSDMRFIMIGIVLIFVGFLILGTMGHEYQSGTLESSEFGTCYEYSADKPPVEIRMMILRRKTNKIKKIF